MPKKKLSPMIAAVTEVAREVDGTVYLEPEWQFAGSLTKGRRTVFFVGGAIDANNSGASALVKDKDYTSHFMARQGYSVVPNSRTFFSEAWGRELGVLDRGVAAATGYAAQIGYPIMVKPNEGKQGTGVSMVRSKAELQKALRSIFQYDRVAIVQSVVMGRDYRVVVLDGEVLVAYERRPLSVTGDGIASIGTLIERELYLQAKRGRPVKVKSDDVRIRAKLKHSRYTLATVPAKGEVVPLLDVANLSLGGSVVDVTGRLHPDFIELAKGAARSVGMAWCGLDFIVQGSIADPIGQYWILEVNAAPGMAHYASAGPKQRARTVAAYKAVFKWSLGQKFSK